MRNSSAFLQRDLLEDLHSIEMEHYRFLVNKWGLFPECCDVSSRLVHDYYVGLYPDLKLVQGKYNGKNHWWLTHNGTVIDFVLLQFFMSDLPRQYQPYEKWFIDQRNAMLGGIFPKEEYLDKYQPICVHTDILYQPLSEESYGEYVNRVYESRSFRQQFSYGFKH